VKVAINMVAERQWNVKSWCATQRLGRASRRLLGSVALVAVTLGCASYPGTAISVQPSVVARDGAWTMVPDFPLVLQEYTNDCGAAALASVLRFWGIRAEPRDIVASLGRGDQPLKASDLTTYARRVGLRSFAFFGSMKDIEHELSRGRPVIVGLGKRLSEKAAVSHYEVIVGLEPNKRQLLLLDPGQGWQLDSVEGFAKEWALSKGVTIVAFQPASAEVPAQPRPL
jgi:hypothetical protein